jgi:hypothetical protein
MPPCLLLHLLPVSPQFGQFFFPSIQEITSMARFKFPSRGYLCPLAAASLALGLAVPAARAELGGNYDSVLADQAALHATLTTQEDAAYTTYILDMPDGTQVREYFSQHSGVFALDWSGIGRRPNMRQVLGAYYARFSRPEGAPRTGRNNPVHRADPDFAFDSRVVMRHFSGRAYIPQAVPQEVAIADVR